jgi:hypothetical protein
LFDQADGASDETKVLEGEDGSTGTRRHAREAGFKPRLPGTLTVKLSQTEVRGAQGYRAQRACQGEGAMGQWRSVDIKRGVLPWTKRA